jgi:hypothetical protein
MKHMRRRGLGGLLVVVTLSPSPAQGQAVAVKETQSSIATTFRDLTGAIEPGRRLVVTTIDGATVRGRFQGLDASRLFIRTGDGNREFNESDVREVRRRGDRLWNGALLGLGAGAVGGMLLADSRPGCDDITNCGAIGFGAGALLGALIGLTVDALMPHDDLLYAGAKAQSRRWSVEPPVGSHGYGARLTKAF